MKKHLLLLLFSLYSLFSIAQSTISYGFRAGVSVAGIRGDAKNSLNSLVDYTNGKVSTSDHTGFFAGGYFSIPIDEVLTFQPGLYYSQKGQVMRGDINFKGVEFLNANATARLTTNYIDIPLVAKANFDGLQFFAGPQVSYLMNADLKMSAGLFGLNLLNKTIDASDQLNRWDMSLTGGMGYRFNNGVNITGAYDHGLSKLDKGTNLNVYNRTIKVGLGIEF